MASGEASTREKLASVEASDDEATSLTSDVHVPSKEIEDQMIKAAEKGDLNTLKDILKPNPNFVNTKFYYKYHGLVFDDCTLLHISAVHGHVNILKYLLSIDADIYAVTNGGENILHFATFGGKFEVLKYLLEKGLDLDINHANNDGNTILHAAAAEDKVKVIKYLLEDKGFDINQVNNHGSTVLHFAAAEDKVKVMKYLLEEKEFDINQVDNDGDTPLHDAAFWGTLKSVKFLTAHGADIYRTNKDRETPLLRAINGDEGSVVRYLINECKMDITQLDQETQSEINEMLQEESSPENSSTEGDGDDKALSDAENGADDNEEEMQHYD